MRDLTSEELDRCDYAISNGVCQFHPLVNDSMKQCQAKNCTHVIVTFDSVELRQVYYPICESCAPKVKITAGLGILFFRHNPVSI